MNTSITALTLDTSHTMPPVLIEKIVSLFSFYLDSQIQQGMRHKFELYRLTLEFQPNDRLKAYQQALELTQAGLDVVITVSKNRYVVWTSLRSSFSEQSPTQSRSDFRPTWERLAV